jgi:hypothetical protein
MAKKNIILKGVLYAIFALIIGITLQIAKAENLHASFALDQATNSASRLGELKVLDQFNTRTLLANGAQELSADPRHLLNV